MKNNDLEVKDIIAGLVNYLLFWVFVVALYYICVLVVWSINLLLGLDYNIYIVTALLLLIRVAHVAAKKSARNVMNIKSGARE